VPCGSDREIVYARSWGRKSIRAEPEAAQWIVYRVDCAGSGPAVVEEVCDTE